MAGHQLLGYSPVFVNWDAWAGHWKPYPVPKPVLPTVEMVGEVFERAIRTGRRSLNDHLRLVGDGKQPAEDEKVWGLPHVNEEARTVIDRYSCMYTDTFSHAELTNMLNQKHGHPADIKVVEIGSFIGDMAKRIAAWCPDAKIWCVDPWVGGYDGTDVVSDVYSRYSPDGVYNAFLLNTEAYRDRVTPLRMTSLEAAKKFEDGSLDCVYIDGEHTAAAVTADIEAWLPKVKPGGLLCGDDYGRHSCPEVKGAVDQALGKVENACFMWYIEKPAVKDEVRKNGHAPKNRIKKALKRAT
jgi:predicted O-methyltransferase YrrM